MKFLEAIGAYRDHLLNHFTTIYPGCVEQEPLPKSASQNLLVSRGGAYRRFSNRQGGKPAPGFVRCSKSRERDAAWEFDSQADSATYFSRLCVQKQIKR